MKRKKKNKIKDTTIIIFNLISIIHPKFKRQKVKNYIILSETFLLFSLFKLKYILVNT